MKTMICGFYGCGNLGDDAILAAISQQEAQFDLGDLVVVSPQQREIDHSKALKVINRKVLVGRRSILRRWWHFRGTQLFALGGGSLIRDFGNSPSSLRTWLIPVMAAQRAGIPTMTFAIGAEAPRYNESADTVRKVLDNCKVVTTRDPGSATRLRDLGIQAPIYVTADPAILLGEQASLELRPSTANRPTVVVTLRHWFDKQMAIEDPETFDKALTGIATALDHVISQFDARVAFVPFRAVPGDDDREIHALVIDRMKSSEQSVHALSEIPNIERLLKIYREADVTLGMRLHALILSASVNTPIISIEYQAKILDFMDYVGQSSNCISISNPNMLEFLEATISRMIVSSGKEREGLAAHVKMMRSQAKKTFQIARQIAESPNRENYESVLSIN
ncbi:MAG: polysaccharide pyruvyl transferase family protein [Dehalococcoidia bacterium]